MNSTLTLSIPSSNWWTALALRIENFPLTSSKLCAVFQLPALPMEHHLDQAPAMFYAPARVSQGISDPFLNNKASNLHRHTAAARSKKAGGNSLEQSHH